MFIEKKKLYLLGCVFSTRWVHENIFICILVLETVTIRGGDRGAGRGPGPGKEKVFPAPPLTIFIFLI